MAPPFGSKDHWEFHEERRVIRPTTRKASVFLSFCGLVLREREKVDGYREHKASSTPMFLSDAAWTDEQDAATGSLRQRNPCTSRRAMEMSMVEAGGGVAHVQYVDKEIEPLTYPCLEREKG